MQVMPISTLDQARLRTKTPSPSELSFSDRLQAQFQDVASAHATVQRPQNITNTHLHDCLCPSDINYGMFYQWIMFQMMMSGSDSNGDFLPPAFFPPLDNKIFS